jgi:hypothetical protein
MAGQHRRSPLQPVDNDFARGVDDLIFGLTKVAVVTAWAETTSSTLCDRGGRGDGPGSHNAPAEPSGFSSERLSSANALKASAAKFYRVGFSTIKDSIVAAVDLASSRTVSTPELKAVISVFVMRLVLP